MDYGRTDWYCGIKRFLSLSTLLFPFYFRCPSTILKFPQRFSKINFLSFIFRYIFRITLTSNKFYYSSQVKVFATCHLAKIYFQSERGAWFYLTQTFNFQFQKHLNIYSEKKLFFENSCSLISKILKDITFNFSKIFEK